MRCFIYIIPLYQLSMSNACEKKNCQNELIQILTLVIKFITTVAIEVKFTMNSQYQLQLYLCTLCQISLRAENNNQSCTFLLNTTANQRVSKSQLKVCWVLINIKTRYKIRVITQLQLLQQEFLLKLALKDLLCFSNKLCLKCLSQVKVLLQVMMT